MLGNSPLYRTMLPQLNMYDKLSNKEKFAIKFNFFITFLIKFKDF